MRPRRLLSLLLSLSMLALGTIGCERDCASSEHCELAPESGPCYAYMIRYYYDKKEKRCKEFVYGGCGGTVPFETLTQCQECTCGK